MDHDEDKGKEPYYGAESVKYLYIGKVGVILSKALNKNLQILIGQQINLLKITREYGIIILL